MIPVNLVAEIASVGFDFRMSARDVADGVVQGHLVLWRREASIDLLPRRESR